MWGGTWGGRVAAIAAAGGLWLACASPALAAGPYHASPAGTGVLCTQLSPCSIDTAVPMAGAGDDVLLAPGTYELTGNLSLGGNLRPETPGTRPLLHSTLGYKLGVGGSSSVVSDIRLETSNVGSAEYALNLQPGARAERVEVIASGSNSAFAAAIQGGATITDSVLVTSGPSATALASGSTGGTLRNVTAVATGAGSYGLFTNPSYMGATPSQTLTIQNSIIRGDTAGFYVYADGTHAITLNVDHSNYPVANTISGGAVLNDPGPVQNAAPLFTNAVAGDYHQLAGSPTVDAGSAVPSLSATDLDGQPRNQGGAPDIGADELNVPAPAPPAATKPKCKKRKAKKQAASAKKKKCKRKKHR